MAQSWYNAIQAGAANLLRQVKEDLNIMQPGMEVKHLGWIIEQVSNNTDLQGFKHTVRTVLPYFIVFSHKCF